MVKVTASKDATARHAAQILSSIYEGDFTAYNVKCDDCGYHNHVALPVDCEGAALYCGNCNILVLGTIR